MEPLVTMLIGVDEEQGPQVFKVDCEYHHLPFYVVVSRAKEKEVINFWEKRVDDMKGYDLDQTVRAIQCLRVTSSWSREGM
eukprot:11418708-Ditylum_brightwellii.AAC.1